ncbi:MAG TPA: polysaccharide deacetylase family protein, partial [Bacillota bacterium]|nr:polysaccharide deacetylase family protein [Bacillota bacterium]
MWKIGKNDIFCHGWVEVQLELREEETTLQTDIVRLFAGESIPIEDKGFTNPNSETLALRDEAKKCWDKIAEQNKQIENNIKVEAGYTPFVLTFDDGAENNFNIIEENGEKKIDPNCAVGILEEFKKEHPDFGSGGSFFIYYPIPFRQKELIKEKYEFLIANGYDIGNHSYNHENLGKLSIEGIQKSLAKNVKSTQEYLPDYDVYALALPNGIGPKGDDYKYAATGEYEGVKYNNRAVLKVGSNPAPSPVNVKFDPIRLPRVRASEMETEGVGMYDWLQYFEKKPEKRYISDGNPDTVAIPESEAEYVDKSRLNGKELVIYKE